MTNDKAVITQTTTIRVREDTKQLLLQLGDMSDTYDTVIRRLIILAKKNVDNLSYDV